MTEETQESVGSNIWDRLRRRKVVQWGLAYSAGAWGLLFATLYEGFGIPVVEAFRCGCPVIGGTKGSVPEVAGNAALLADPANEDEIASQVEQLLTNESLRADLRNKGLERAKAFSWEQTARETMAVYRELT